MKDMNELVNELVEDIEMPEDIPVAYEVWAIGFDEEDVPNGASMLLTTFSDPDKAVAYAKELTLAEVVNLAAEDDYDDLTYETHSISIEVETVVPSADEEELNMNVGTVYKKRIEIFEEVPDFVVLFEGDFEVIEETGLLQIPCARLKDYNKNDIISVVFGDEGQTCPIDYKIISKTASGYYICDFV